MRTLTPRVLSAAIVLALGVAACGQSTSEPTAERRVLTVVMADDWADTEPVIAAARSLEEDLPGVEVRLEGVAFSDVPTTVLSRMASGQDVGVAQWHAFAAGNRDWAEPLTEEFEARFDASVFLESAMSDVRWGDTIYGVPLDTNAMVMITNDDMLREVGVDPAELRTLEDVAEASRKVHDRDPRQAGFVASASSWTTYGFIRANGGELIESTPGGDPVFSFDDPAVLETFELLAGLAAEDAVIPPNRPNFSGDSTSAFLAQDTAILFSGSWDVATLLERQDSTDGLGFEFSVWPMPGADDGTGGGTTLGGSSVYVPRGSEQMELAMEFIERLTSDETGLALWEQEGRIPAKRALLEESSFAREPVYEVVVRQLPTASAMRLIAFPEADVLYENALPRLLSGQDDVVEILRGIQAELAPDDS